jgi:hypothetical protein
MTGPKQRNETPARHSRLSRHASPSTVQRNETLVRHCPLLPTPPLMTGLPQAPGVGPQPKQRRNWRLCPARNAGGDMPSPRKPAPAKAAPKTQRPGNVPAPRGATFPGRAHAAPTAAEPAAGAQPDARDDQRRWRAVRKSSLTPSWPSSRTDRAIARSCMRCHSARITPQRRGIIRPCDLWRCSARRVGTVTEAVTGIVSFLQDWRVAARLRALSAWRRPPAVNQVTGRAIFRFQPLPLEGRVYAADNDAGGCPGLRA